MNKQLNINKMKNLNYKTMRKLVFTLLMLLTLSLNAQEKEVIKFMGIPVDGTKSEMIAKLEEKGFSPDVKIIEFENMEKEIERGGKEVIGGKIRERDDLEYFMNGHFDGKQCTLVIMSYKTKVYKVCVLFESSYMDKINAFTTFNYYAEKLQNKYFDDSNFYRLLDYSGELKPNADFMNAFFVRQNEVIGMITLHITYPITNMEYHIILEYLNSNNMPNGEDL